MTKSRIADLSPLLDVNEFVLPWFLKPTGVSLPNGISIGPAVFAGFRNMTNRHTDRETDHATLSDNNSSHIAMHAMWPKIVFR